MTIMEVYYYTSCTLTMTGSATVTVNEEIFTADTITWTFVDPPTPLIITWRFPSVTLTSLTPLETLLYVFICVI